MSQIKNVVLVHGGFVDGSGWRQVHELLTADGYQVSVVQNPTLSLAGDVLATLRVLRAQDGPCVLVGHSYGGAVITEAGVDDSVAALAYIAAFVPDAGESVAALSADPAPGAPAVPIVLPPRDGSGNSRAPWWARRRFVFLDRAKFRASFAGDLPAEVAAFLADSQVPWGVDALGGEVTQPAWRHKPSWYLVATEDRIIAPAVQRSMAERAGATVSEVAASHAVYISQPQATADLIKQAASAGR